MTNTNLLSPNLASVEASTAEFYYQNVTISRSSDWAAVGTYSLKVTADSDYAAYAAIGNVDGGAGTVPVVGGQAYTFVCTMRSTDQTSVYYHPTIRWFTAADVGTYADSNNVYPTPEGAAYVCTATAPADAVKASILFTADSALTIGTSIYFDKIGFWQGSDTTWAAPTNLLTLNQQYGGDPAGNTTGFAATGGTPATLSYTTAQQHAGAGSVLATCGGATASQGAVVTIPAGTLSAGTHTFSLWFRVSTSGNSYTVSAVNDLDGTWFADTAVRAQTTWINYSTTVSVSAAAAAQATTFGVWTATAISASIWLDDLVVAGGGSGGGATSPAGAVTATGSSPGVMWEVVVTGGGSAAVTAAAPAPTVTGNSGNPFVTAPAAAVTAAAAAPLVLGSTSTTVGVAVYVATTGSPTHFPAPSWTNVTASLLADTGVTFSSGVSGAGGQEWGAGSFSFTLRNTAGTYSGPSLLRRPVLLRMVVGASTVDHRGVITDVVEYRDGVRRLVISGTDVLGLVADLEVGQTYDEQLTTNGATSRWQLTADGTDSRGGRALSEDPWSGAPLPASQDYSGQVPVFGPIDGCPALSGGGVTLEPAADTGYRGLYASVPGTTTWTWAAWCFVPLNYFPSSSRGIVVSVVMSDGGIIGVGHSTPVTAADPLASAMYWQATNRGGAYVSGGWPKGQWLWVTLGATSSGVVVATTRNATGTLLTTSTIGTLSAGVTPVGVTLGGMMGSVWQPAPATVQIADAVWATESSATDLYHGHIGYPGETVSARSLRLLTEAGLIPTTGTWNGATPPTGPTLSDEPLARRPLTEALQQALDSGGFTIHDLPATSSGATSLGVLWPDALDGVDTAITTYAGTRVLLASDGVTTNTGMLVNTATITNATTQAQTTYTDATSVATYGRRAAQVTSWSQSADYSASHASWLAHREADPTNAYGLPDLVLDVNGMVADGHTATVVAMARTGACVTITGLLPGGGDYSGVVRGLQWQQTPQGAMRLTLRCQPRRAKAYAELDDAATATLDNVIIGW